MRGKKKGSIAGKQIEPKRKNQLHSKIQELKSQENLLLFMFVESREEIITDPVLDGIWNFMEFLKAGGYRIIRGGKNGRERDNSNQPEKV